MQEEAGLQLGQQRGDRFRQDILVELGDQAEVHLGLGRQLHGGVQQAELGKRQARVGIILAVKEVHGEVRLEEGTAVIDDQLQEAQPAVDVGTLRQRDVDPHDEFHVGIRAGAVAAHRQVGAVCTVDAEAQRQLPRD